MANYADGAWGAAQYKMSELVQTPEFKHKPSATLLTLRKSTDLLVPASEIERIADVKKSDQQSVDIVILNKQSTSAVTARAAAHTGSINDDNKATLSFVTRGRTFKYSMKGADRNIWELADQIAKQTLSAIIDVHGTLETYFLGLLNTNKTQVVSSLTPKSGLWDATNYLFQILSKDDSRKFQRIRGFMREQFYEGVLDSVMDEYFYQEWQHLLSQGVGNATNLSYQSQSLVPEVTEELTTDSGYLGMGYVFPRGTVGVVDWAPKMNKQGFGSIFQTGGQYSTLLDPFGSGITFSVHQYASAADNNSAAGETQDIDIQVEITADVALVMAPLSTSNLSPIVKFGMLES